MIYTYHCVEGGRERIRIPFVFSSHRLTLIFLDTMILFELYECLPFSLTCDHVDGLNTCSEHHTEPDRIVLCLIRTEESTIYAFSGTT
jgi:hypothetical protein